MTEIERGKSQEVFAALSMEEYEIAVKYIPSSIMTAEIERRLHIGDNLKNSIYNIASTCTE